MIAAMRHNAGLRMFGGLPHSISIVNFERGRLFPFDKNYLKFYLERQLEFGAKHKVPMLV
jgi:hypothetical protein